jgi:4-hydroxy 2-oxovalerate aldolase
MINNVKIFDCTLREVGYQTGWYFSDTFAKQVYKFALGKGIDYVELGFFHNITADPGKGNYRYCSTRNDEIKQTFQHVKNITKLAAMRDVQRPLSELVPAEDSIIDTIRLLTRSNETDFKVLEEHIDLCHKLGYELFINFTSSGYNTMERNREFAHFAREMGVDSIEFADTESVMTRAYVTETIAICHDEGVKVGVHLHDKNGTAEELADLALSLGADYMDVTHLGLGGKWRDGNLTMEYLLRKMNVQSGYESTVIKNALIDELIKYHEYSVAE